MLKNFIRFRRGEHKPILTKSLVRVVLWFPVGLIGLFVIYQHLGGLLSF